MSLLKDFTELQFSTKSVLLAVSLLMPFWYLDLFLFAEKYVSNKSIEIPIIISFCLSVLFLVLNSLSYSISCEVSKTMKKYDNPRIFIIWTTGTSVINISLFTYIWFFLGYGFFCFMTSVFLWTIVRVIFWGTLALIKKK